MPRRTCRRPRSRRAGSWSSWRSLDDTGGLAERRIPHLVMLERHRVAIAEQRLEHVVHLGIESGVAGEQQPVVGAAQVALLDGHLAALDHIPGGGEHLLAVLAIVVD